MNFFRRSNTSSAAGQRQQNNNNIIHAQQLASCQKDEYKMKSVNTNDINTINEETKNDGTFDPTYGFAKFAAKNNVYFQSTSVNGTSNNNLQQQQSNQMIFTTPPTSPSMFQDILFPLRTSTGSRKSEKSPNSLPNQQSTENMVKKCEPNRKRVKFNENIIFNFSPNTTTTTNNLNLMRNNQNYNKSKFDFSVNNEPQQQQHQLSLRQRLTNFFSSLF